MQSSLIGVHQIPARDSSQKQGGQLMRTTLKLIYGLHVQAHHSHNMHLAHKENKICVCSIWLALYQEDISENDIKSGLGDFVPHYVEMGVTTEEIIMT